MTGSTDTVLNQPLDYGDIIAISVYFMLVLATGIYAMCKSNRNTISGYFLAGRYMTWIPVGASMFASNIGSEHFIGLAGSGAAAGIAVGAFEFNALFLLQLLGWVFLPVYMASKVSTLPEYLEKRFGGQRLRIFLAVLSLLLYVFTKISVNMYAGALFIKQTMGWNLYLSIILLLTLTVVCTIAGGLTAVIYTDTMQFVVMIIGGTVLMVRGFIEVGGYSELQTKYMQAIPNKTIPGTTCGIPRNDSWTMLRNPIDSDMPWPGFLLGQTPASIWYWCADQLMVQRALAAKTLSHAQGATLFTGYIKILPIFMMVLPGMISRVLYPDIVACALPEECEKYCENPKGCSNLAYPLLVIGLLPTGLRGVMLAVMLAALMSDLTSIFNSSSTLFTIDIWNKLRKHASPTELLVIGRLFIVLMAAISIVWIPIIVEMQGGQLYLYIQAVAAYFSPPIAAIYIMAVLWKRMNETGAFWGLLIGFAVGAVRMALDFYFKEPLCGQPDTRPIIISRVHYMYFATILFWQTILVVVIISLLSKPPDKSMLIRTTFWTRFDKETRDDDIQLDASFVINSNSYDNKLQLELAQIDGHRVIFSNGNQQYSPALTNDDVHVKVKEPTSDEKRVVHEIESVTRFKRCCLWVCGINSSRSRAEMAMTFTDHLEEIATLEQNPKAKLFLNINLAIIIAVGVSFYIGFSIGGLIDQ